MHFPRLKNFGEKNIEIGGVQSQKIAIFFGKNRVFCARKRFKRAQAFQARVRLNKFFFLKVDNVGYSQPKFFSDTTNSRGDIAMRRFGLQFTGSFKIRTPWHTLSFHNFYICIFEVILKVVFMIMEIFQM